MALRKLNESDFLKFKTLSPEEKKQKGILGRLYGPVASCVQATRNGRKYSEELWEKLLKSDIIKERFANGGIFGELCHPDYEEVDFNKVACVMPEPPVRDKNGKLIGYVDIIDSPCGRIAYTLAKYGYHFGISSRGTGDLIEDVNGEELVDPDTYQLNAFDLVELPACKDARITFTECVDLKKDKLIESLNKTLDKATDTDRKIMEEVLDSMDIEVNKPDNTEDWEEVTSIKSNGILYRLFRKIVDGKGLWMAQKEGTEEKFPITYNQALGYDPIEESIECTDESLTDKEAEEVVDDESSKLVAELTEALQKVKMLEELNKSLNEQLSVCNAKVAGGSDELAHYKAAIANLSDKAKEVKPLKKSLNDLNESLISKDKLIESNESRIRSLVDSRKNDSKKLKESAQQIDKLTSSVNDLTNKLEDSEKQLNESKVLVAKYRTSYRTLKENYLEVKASLYGISKEDVLQNLNESYKIRDIDKVCEDLADKKRRFDKLPFELNENTSIKYVSNEHTIKDVNSDDYVSESLLLMTNM